MRPHLLMRLDPGQQRIHGQGVDQSSGPAGGGGDDTWWRRGWGGTTKKPERLEKSLSSLLSPCHTLWPLSFHPSVCAGPERLLGDTLPLPPIHPSPPLSSYTNIHKHIVYPPLIHSHLFYLPPLPRGICPALFITALRHRAFLSVQSYWFQRPRRWDVLFSRFSPVPILPLGQGHSPVAPAESGEKLCLMND